MKKTIVAIIVSLTTSVTYSQMPNTLSREDKVYGLAKIWEEVNYNFVYLERINRTAWDSTFKSLTTSVQRTENDYQYYRELQKFCAMLHDGHTNVYFPRSIDTLVFISMFGKYRISLANIGGKAVVVSTNLSIKDQIPIGARSSTSTGWPLTNTLLVA